MLCAEGGKKTEVGSVNCLHWDCKLSQEDAWKQLIIVCVCTVFPCVYNTTVAPSVKWKMIDEKKEVVWEERELVVVMLTGNLVQTSLAKVKAYVFVYPACLYMYMMSLANFNLILLKRTLLLPKMEKHPLALVAKGVQYNLMCLDEGYELGSNDI